MDLAQTLWIAFDKKQPTTEKFIDWVQEMEICNVFEYPYNADWRLLQLIFDFNNYLQKTLELEMLVAMKDGEVLVKPINQPELGDGYREYHRLEKAYQQAMESVLYEGFDIGENSEKKIWFNNEFSWIKETETLIRHFENPLLETISDMTGEPIKLNWWKEVVK